MILLKMLLMGEAKYHFLTTSKLIQSSVIFPISLIHVHFSMSNSNKKCSENRNKWFVFIFVCKMDSVNPSMFQDTRNSTRNTYMCIFVKTVFQIKKIKSTHYTLTHPPTTKVSSTYRAIFRFRRESEIFGHHWILFRQYPCGLVW